MKTRLVVALLIAATIVLPQHTPVAHRQVRSAPHLDRATMYSIFLRRFTPEGTLKAATAKLPHIAGLGANIIYLSPVMMHSRAGGYANPYRQSDYDAVDPEYGTEADLKAFVDRAHELKLKVILDVVYFHTGPDSVLFKRPGFHMRTPEGKVIGGIWRLPRLDFGNPELREYVIGNMTGWVRKFGLDGYRVDVSWGMPLVFWEQVREALDKINPELILLAESENPEEQLRAFDISYHYYYQFQGIYPVFRDGQPASRIRRVIDDERSAWPRGFRLLRACDDVNVQSGTPVEFGEKGAYAATVLGFALDGIPMLYNGQEFNDTAPRNHNDPYPMRWPAGGREMESVERYRTLFRIRKEEPALSSGELIWVDNNAPESVISFLRTKGNDSILVVINASNRRMPVALDLLAVDHFPAVNLLTGRNRGSTWGTTKVGFVSVRAPNELAPFEALVLKRLPPTTVEVEERGK